MAENLETARLVLRPWSDSDASLLCRLSADPRVVRYIGKGRPWSSERAAEESEGFVEHWLMNGFGWRVAIEKKTHEPVGFSVLDHLGGTTAGLDPHEFQIGWWLMPSAWGRGLASEGARAMCQEAFGRVGAASVVARLQPENVASARVAVRLGMSYEFETTGRFGERIAVYRLNAADWKGRQGQGGG